MGEGRLRQVALRQDAKREIARQHRVGGSLHAPPTGEKCKRPSAGGGEQRRELVVHQRLVAIRAWIGEMRRAVKQSLFCVVERASDVHRRRRSIKAEPPGEIGRDRRAGQDRRCLRPRRRVEACADLDRRDAQYRTAGSRRRVDPCDANVLSFRCWVRRGVIRAGSRLGADGTELARLDQFL